MVGGVAVWAFVWAGLTADAGLGLARRAGRRAQCPSRRCGSDSVSVLRTSWSHCDTRWPCSRRSALPLVAKHPGIQRLRPIQSPRRGCVWRQHCPCATAVPGASVRPRLAERGACGHARGLPQGYCCDTRCPPTSGPICQGAANGDVREDDAMTPAVPGASPPPHIVCEVHGGPPNPFRPVQEA